MVAHRPDMIDVQWMTNALRQAGAIRDASVIDIAQRRVGTGQVGMNVIFALTYDTDPGPDAPGSVVGKFASPDEMSRATGIATDTYMRETRFYRHIYPTISMRVPRPYLVEENPDTTTGEFVILMEDMTPAVQGDQLTGCDAATAELAVRELAGLQAPWWNNPALADHTWLQFRNDEGLANLQMFYNVLWPGFWAAYGPELPDYAHGVGSAFTERLTAYVSPRGPETITHGDYRLDNMLFGTVAGGPPITVVDWQTPGRGLGVSDAAYFIGTSVLETQRAGLEADLIRAYREALVAGGVRGYSYDDCFADYRSTILSGFLMAVIASQIVATDQRGHDMFLAMARRSVIAAHELGVIGGL